MDTGSAIVAGSIVGGILLALLVSGAPLRRDRARTGPWRAPRSPAGPAARAVRRYRGSRDEARRAFEADAPVAAAADWYPVSQQYVPGAWGGGTWVAAFLAVAVAVGIIVLAYMAANRPPGELLVVYEYRHPRPRAVPEPAQSGSGQSLPPTESGGQQGRAWARVGGQRGDL
jgi:hypothetical protein